MAYSCNPPEPPEPQARTCGSVPANSVIASPDAPDAAAATQPGDGALEVRAGLDVPAGQPSCVAPEAPDALVCWINTEQAYTATCGTGRTGTAVTRTYPAGRITSNISQADADDRARAIAQAEAEAALACDWWNEAQSYTAICGPGTSGNSITKTIAAQTVHRPTLEEANAVAYEMAREQAIAELICLYLNETQSYTAVCEEGTLGEPVTVVKGPSEEFMAESVAAANALALAAAQAEAEAGLDCVPDFFGALVTFVMPTRGALQEMGAVSAFITPQRGSTQTLNLGGVTSFITPSFGATQSMGLDAISSFLSPTIGEGEEMDLNAVSTFLN